MLMHMAAAGDATIGYACIGDELFPVNHAQVPAGSSCEEEIDNKVCCCVMGTHPFVVF